MSLEVVAVDLDPIEIVSELIAGPAGAAGPPGPAGQDATLPADVTQAEAEAGTLVADRMWSPERVAQAIAALGGGVLVPVEALGPVTNVLNIDLAQQPRKALTATLGSVDCTISVTNAATGAYESEFALILTTGAVIPTVMTWANMTNPPTLAPSKVYEINGRSIDGVNYRLLTVEVV